MYYCRKRGTISSSARLVRRRERVELAPVVRLHQSHEHSKPDSDDTSVFLRHALQAQGAANDPAAFVSRSNGGGRGDGQGGDNFEAPPRVHTFDIL